MADPITRCPKCDGGWTGFNTAHCTGCHSTFTGITAFDKHRTGSHAKSTRSCLDPDTVGLVDAGRAYPCWGLPWTEGGKRPAAWDAADAMGWTS